ncbi:hypothetical protein IAQ61_006993 [Plenodomus lingam]|uniref:Predicted protein n=1 Tax=Leptosphaeria maculans (strain JN3 / isolate v23.1.3 / race Av1-4-5-6-7-8) TaxID=985895 RepID=E5AD53_LEPMJ|nr:predicted protein [Plenodomus lingam JN3]KAH9869780.1 hypothetical protein IAQ61_006993 [Plenodomus lingam]CBY02405.1 predicted protein [Plenodomus lingam JN3]
MSTAVADVVGVEAIAVAAVAGVAIAGVATAGVGAGATPAVAAAAAAAAAATITATAAVQCRREPSGSRREQIALKEKRIGNYSTYHTTLWSDE